MSGVTCKRWLEHAGQVHSQVKHQHGYHHHDKAAEGRVEIDDAEQDHGTENGVHPVQPVPIQLVFVQDLSSLGVHLDILVDAGCLRLLALRIMLVRLGRGLFSSGGGCCQ